MTAAASTDRIMSATVTRVWEREQEQSKLLRTSASSRVEVTVPKRRLQQSKNGAAAVHDFVALGIFMILALGSVLLTCYVHRRRRKFEARMALVEQENAMAQHQWHDNGYFRIVNELVQAERARLLVAELKDTTMIIAAGDLARQEEDNLEASTVANGGRVVATEGKGSVIENKDKTTTTPASAAVNLKGGDSSDDNMYDVEMGAEPSVSAADMEEAEYDSVVRLPSSLPIAGTVDDASVSHPAVNGDRWVPGVCTICFRMYEIGEQLTWSKRTACCHAFHTECIIPWLAKTEFPECPVCRQIFCDPQQVFVTATTTKVISPQSPASSSSLQPAQELTHGTLESTAITSTLLDSDTGGTTTDDSIAAPFECPCSQVEHSTIHHDDSSVTPNFLFSRGENSQRITVPEEGMPLSLSPGLRRCTSCIVLGGTSNQGSTTNAGTAVILVRSTSLVVLSFPDNEKNSAVAAMDRSNSLTVLSIADNDNIHNSSKGSDAPPRLADCLTIDNPIEF